MRAACNIVLLFCLSFYTSAQTYMDTHDPKSKEVKSLLGKGNDLDGFGGADLKLSKIKEDRTLLMGMYAGAIVNRNYLVGVGAYGLVSDNDFYDLYQNQTEAKKLNLRGGYGGLLIGATLWTREVIHLSFPILFGAGALDLDDNRFHDGVKGMPVTVDQSAFIVVEPAAQIEINITKNFRIAGGVTYRYIAANGFKQVSDAELSGWSSVLSFRFGRY